MLGRWQCPDPYGEFHSPYLAMGNNPISTIDPTGGYTSDQFWGSSEAPDVGEFKDHHFGANYGEDDAMRDRYAEHGYEDAYAAISEKEQVFLTSKAHRDFRKELQKEFSWGLLGITTDNVGGYYQKYNYSLIGSYGSMLGSSGFEDITDIVNEAFAVKRALTLDKYYRESAEVSWRYGNYSDWFSYRLKATLGEDFDKRSEKMAQPYAKLIADLNPLMNGAHIVSGISTGSNGYGEKMTGGDYAMAGFGIFGLGELKGGATVAKEVTQEAPRVISSMSVHSVNQAITRGFKSSDILKVVKEGTATMAKSKFGNPQWRYMMNGNTVVIDAAKNRVITIFSNAPGTANKLGAGYINPFK